MAGRAAGGPAAAREGRGAKGMSIEARSAIEWNGCEDFMDCFVQHGRAKTMVLIAGVLPKASWLLAEKIAGLFTPYPRAVERSPREHRSPGRMKPITRPRFRRPSTVV